MSYSQRLFAVLYHFQFRNSQNGDRRGFPTLAKKAGQECPAYRGGFRLRNKHGNLFNKLIIRDGIGLFHIRHYFFCKKPHRTHSFFMPYAGEIEPAYEIVYRQGFSISANCFNTLFRRSDYALFLCQVI